MLRAIRYIDTYGLKKGRELGLLDFGDINTGVIIWSFWQFPICMQCLQVFKTA